MSSDFLFLLLATGTGALIIGLFGYGAYWGFRVRAVLIDRLYKTRALWIATVATLFMLLVIANLVIGFNASTNWTLSLLLFLIESAGAALTFACVDTPIQVARRSDPLQTVTRKVIPYIVVSFSTLSAG